MNGSGVQFDFNAITDSAMGVLRDLVMDFDRNQGDRIDLSTMDATTLSSGNHLFAFIDAGDVSDGAGQARALAGGLAGGTFVPAGDFVLRLVKIGKMGLLAGSFFALQAAAQEVQTTRMLGVVVNHADTALFRGGPEKLRTILRKVGDFYAEGSGGTHAFVAEVHPTVLRLTQTRPEGRCQLPDSDRLSTALRDAGVSLSGFRALVLVVPPSKLGCPGGVQTAFRHQEADGSLRTVPLAVAWSITPRYIAHEILHTHGLGHANSLRCRKGSLAADCRVREYGNAWDLMGFDGGNLHMLSAPMRTSIGWTKPVGHVGGNATYTIAAATRPEGRPTAVKVRLPFAGNESMKVRQPLALWIEYRAPYGSDQRMTRFENFAAGAMVNLTGSWQYGIGAKARTVDCPQRAPCLLDMTPETPSLGDAGLAVGRTWTEPFTGTLITVQSRTDTSLTVTVTSP